jgi:hypothetical protein
MATSSSDYSITVEACVRDAQRLKYVWTLRLNGFKKGGHYIYIYHITKGRVTPGHCVANPAEPIVIDSWDAKLFDVSKQDEYRFR